MPDRTMLVPIPRDDLHELEYLTSMIERKPNWFPRGTREAVTRWTKSARQAYKATREITESAPHG